MTKPTTPAPTETYAAAFKTLSDIAARLSSPAGVETSIDTLAADIREARAAHAACRARLEAVRREIEAELGETTSGG